MDVSPADRAGPRLGAMREVCDPMTDQRFSQQLEDWLRSEQPKTLGELQRVFAEKSFAVLVVVLMLIPALPTPTGGVTHLFELITMHPGCADDDRAAHSLAPAPLAASRARSHHDGQGDSLHRPPVAHLRAHLAAAQARTVRPAMDAASGRGVVLRARARCRGCAAVLGSRHPSRARRRRHRARGDPRTS